jgi:hypothetical protein
MIRHPIEVFPLCANERLEDLKSRIVARGPSYRMRYNASAFGDAASPAAIQWYERRAAGIEPLVDLLQTGKN